MDLTGALPSPISMSESSLEGLLKIFAFEKKSELEHYCRTLQVSGNDFVSLKTSV